MIIFWTSLINYLLASIFSFSATKTKFANKLTVLLLMIGAMIAHGIILHEYIDLDLGQNLCFFNIVSFSMWIISLLVWMMSIFYYIELLVGLVSFLATVSIILIMIFPDVYVVNTAQEPVMLFHILISIFTFCVLSLAGFLAMLLTLQESLLRFRSVHVLAERLPALQTTETLLFQVLRGGFALLTIVLLTSIDAYHALLMKNMLLLQKTFLVVVAWTVLLLLLIGRCYHGWRGQRAANYTLTAMLLLLTAYFLSQFVLVMRF